MVNLKMNNNKVVRSVQNDQQKVHTVTLKAKPVLQDNFFGHIPKAQHEETRGRKPHRSNKEGHSRENSL